MRDFAYVRAGTTGELFELLAGDRHARILAGGVDLVGLCKDGIEQPDVLVDIGALDLAAIEVTADGLVLGALCRMSDVAADPRVRAGWPAVAEALAASASPQLRNMATLAGNLLQRTRCPHFRADTELPCNQRRPGSGCSARDADRTMAVLGGDEHCVATHPSDLAVALTALDARLRLRSARGSRELAVAELFAVSPGATGEHTTLRPGELVTAVVVPDVPGAATSTYVKVRERASFEFALVSAAAAVTVDGGRITSARVALGGVAARPWPLTGAADRLAGACLTEAELRRAIEPDLTGARTRSGTARKPELAVRAAIRAVQRSGGHR